MENTDLVALVRNAWHSSVTEAERARQSGKSSGDGEPEPGDYTPFFDLLDEDVVWQIGIREDTPHYGGQLKGKQAVISLFTSEPERLVDVDWERPPEFVGSGDRVVMLGQERYRIVKSDVELRNSEVAMVMDFKNDKIVSILHIADFSEWSDAYREPGWSTQPVGPTQIS